MRTPTVYIGAMKNETAIARAIRLGGGTAEVARKLSESPQTISNWIARGAPANRCVALEALTGVDRRELRPADWRDYWPDLEAKVA